MYGCIRGLLFCSLLFFRLLVMRVRDNLHWNERKDLSIKIGSN